MKLFALSVFAVICGYISHGQSHDTIITLDGDTSLVKVIAISPKDVSYEIPSSPGVVVTKSISTIESVGFADSNMEDYLAPNHTLMNESFYIYGGLFANTRYEFTTPTIGFGADWYFYKGFGMDLDFGFGINDETQSINHLQFGLRLKYRLNGTRTNWFTTQSLGIRSLSLENQYNANNTDLIYEFTTSIGYTFNSGIEVALDLPVGVNKSTYLSTSPQLRLGFRF